MKTGNIVVFLFLILTVLYVKLVDITHSFRKPHILDIKIGAFAWEPTAAEDKIQRLKSKCPYLDEIRFQIIGAKVSTQYMQAVMLYI